MRSLANRSHRHFFAIGQQFALVSAFKHPLPYMWELRMCACLLVVYTWRVIRNRMDVAPASTADCSSGSFYLGPTIRSRVCLSTSLAILYKVGNVLLVHWLCVLDELSWLVCFNVEVRSPANRSHHHFSPLVSDSLAMQPLNINYHIRGSWEYVACALVVLTWRIISAGVFSFRGAIARNRPHRHFSPLFSNSLSFQSLNIHLYTRVSMIC